MTNGNQDFVKVMKVKEFVRGALPKDITDVVLAEAPGAKPRILSRLESADTPDGENPLFFSLSRTCTHQGCDVLSGGSWNFSEKPIAGSMVDADGNIRAVVQCPCHGTRFDLTTGEVVRMPESGSATPLPRFSTKIEDVEGEPTVFVSIEPVEDGPAIA